MTAIKYEFQPTGQKDVETAFKSIATASQSSTKSVIKDADQQVKAMEKVAKAINKLGKTAEKDRIASSKSATDAILKDYERQANAAEKLAERMDSAFSKVGNKSKSGFGAIGAMAATAMAAVTAAITAAATLAARETMRLQELSTRVAVSGRGYGQALSDPGALRRSFEATAIATPGVSSEEVAAGAHAFVKRTGRLDIAQQMQDTWATTASATGAKVEDIANAAADLFEKFDIKTVEGMRDAFAQLAFQGKHGAFELKDAAGEYGKLAAAASRFNIGKGVGAVATLGGLTQIARRANSSPEEAATSIERMFSHLIEHSGKLGAQGIHVFNPAGGSRDIQDILLETITKLGGGNFGQKKVQLEKIFGERGIRAVSPMIDVEEEAYNKARAKGKNATEAMAEAELALKAYLDDNINAQASWTEIQKDAATSQKIASAQLTAAWENIKNKISDEAVPALTKLATFINGMFPSKKEKDVSQLSMSKQDVENKIRARTQQILNDPNATSMDDVANDPELKKLNAEKERLNGLGSQGMLSKEEMVKKFKADFYSNHPETNPITNPLQWLAKDYMVNKAAEQTVDQFMKNGKTGDIKGFDMLNPDTKIMFEHQKELMEHSFDNQAAKVKDEAGVSYAGDLKDAAADLKDAAREIKDISKNLPHSSK